jgi:regulatory factor X, other
MAMLSQNQQRSPVMGPEANAPMRSRSNTASSSKRPRSEGSTTSDHSLGTTAVAQFSPGDVPTHQPAQYMMQMDQPTQRTYPQDPAEMLLQYNQQYQHPPQAQFDPSMASQHPDMPPNSQQSFASPDLQQYAMMQGYPHGMPQYNISHEHIHHQHARSLSRNFDGVENQSPAPEDSENPDVGGKRKKGAATSLANDAELRRLLKQYQSKTLKEVASEVQRKEGGEGKSEKAKQVFAMLWCVLQMPLADQSRYF